MRGLFDLDSPLMNVLGKIFDCIMLSLCWISASLPIITMGAACGALNASPLGMMLLIR